MGQRDEKAAISSQPSIFFFGGGSGRGRGRRNMPQPFQHHFVSPYFNALPLGPPSIITCVPFLCIGDARRKKTYVLRAHQALQISWFVVCYGRSFHLECPENLPPPKKKTPLSVNHENPACRPKQGVPPLCSLYNGCMWRRQQSTC